MKLLASGRAADIYDLGDRVLKRYRDGALAEHEAAMTEHARRHGFPVPAVHDADGPDLVLERIAGPTMLDELARRPQRAIALAGVLGALHAQLHTVPAPGERPTAGLVLTHLDLHPANVLLSPNGPVVIDWTDARAGTAVEDVAQTLILLRTSVVPDSVALRLLASMGRRTFVRAYLARADARPTADDLRRSARARLGDPHLLPRERVAVERLASATSRSGG